MILDNLVVVTKKDGQWYLGKINNGSVNMEVTVKAPSSVPDSQKFVTLKQYLERIGYEPSEYKIILSDLKIDSMYVKIKDVADMNDKEWRDYYWGNINKLCKTCKKTCKQSHLTTIVSCPLYKKV